MSSSLIDIPIAFNSPEMEKVLKQNKTVEAKWEEDASCTPSYKTGL